MAEGGEAADYVEDIIAGSDFGCDFPCQPCGVEELIVESSGFCVTCDEYLCDDCYRHHKKFKLSRHHVLLDKDAMPKDSSERRIVDVCTEPCKVHTGKVIEYYCPKHDDFGCSVCMTMDHKRCIDYKYIPDVAKDLNLDENEEFRDLNKNAADIRMKASNSEKNIAKLRKSASDKLKSFKNIKQKVYDHFESTERQLVEELNSIKAYDEEKVTCISKKYEHVLTQTELLLKKCELMSKHKQMCKLFMHLKHAKHEMTSMAKDLEKSEKVKFFTDYKIVVNNNIHAILKSKEPVGKLKTSPEYGIVEKLQEYAIKQDGDSRLCWISGLTLLSANRLVAVDRANDKVKVLDLDKNKVASIYTLHTNAESRDIARLSDNQVAVACETGEVIFLDIADSSQIQRNKIIKLNGKCCGITCANDRLVVTFIDIGRLCIMTLNGDIVKTIELNIDGTRMFQSPHYVNFDHKRGVLLVTNESPNSVTSLNLDGTVNSVYKYSYTAGFLGVVTDSFESVYICCWRSNEIRMVSNTFSSSNMLLQKTDGLHQPYSICIDEDADEFYVGMRESNKIVSYSLP